MSRQALNEAFARTSFLQGANAAYIEEMQALYERNPGAVSNEWRLFFQSLQEEKGRATAEKQGPSWARPLDEIDQPANPALLAALPGDYAGAERKTGEKSEGRAPAVGHD